jgi:hypothetical protein
LRMREIVDRTQKPTRRILARSENSKIGQCTLTQFLHPYASRTSSPPPDPVCAKCEKIAFKTQERSLRSLKDVPTSVQLLVQSRHPNRAPNKII